MSRLSECMAKARMPAEDMAEVRTHANAAPDERAGVERYLAGLHDDLESLRTHLADNGHDLAVRRYTPPEPPRKSVGAAAVPPKPKSFLEWLAGAQYAGRRGMFDDSGELKARDAVNHFIPGKGKPFTLNKDRGISPDDVRKLAIDEGYLPEGAGVEDVYNLIDHELAGRKQYRPEEAAQAKDAVDEKMGAYRADLERVADEYGVDHTGLADKDLEALLHAKTAEEEADREADRLEREAIEAELEAPDNAPHEQVEHTPGDSAVPGFEGEGPPSRGGQDQAETRPSGGVEPGEGGEPHARDGEESAREEDDGSRESVEQPLSEKIETVDGKRDQLVIPGAERSAKQAAEARPERLKGSKPQKAADEGGLFGEGHKQGTLFSQDRAPEGWTHAENEVGVSPEETAAALESMRAALDQAGLKDVSASIVDKFQKLTNGTSDTSGVQGRWRTFSKTIELAKWVALGGRAPKVLGHEMTHAMKALGLLKDHEWKALETAADRMWMDKYRIEERYAHLPREKQLEEAIAEAFGDFYAGKGVGPKTAVGRFFQRLVDGLKAIGRWATSDEAAPFLKTFEAMHRGDVGRRDRAGAKGEDAFSVAPKTDTPEFKKWFGESRVVDTDGKPRVMYHGTSKAEDGRAFTSFDTYASQYGLMGQGGYFTADPHVASSYTTKGRGENPSVYPVYLSIKKPIDMAASADVAAWKKSFGDDIEEFHEGGSTNENWYRAAEEATIAEQLPQWEGAERMQDGIRAMGYDGITHIGGGRRDANSVRHRVYIAFDPEQVKSVFNRGTFEHDNPRMSESRATKGPAGFEDARGRKRPAGAAVPEATPPAAAATPARGPIGRSVNRIGRRLQKLVEEHAPALLEVADDIRMGLNPMSAGSDVARSTAKDFANSVRQSRWEWTRVDRLIADTFTPEQRRHMWEAADEQSVLEQQGKKTKGKGLDRLNPQERAAVEGLQKTADETFDIAQKLGMIHTEGLPSYVPRMIVDMSTGKAITSKATGESSNSLDAIGNNLRTSTSQLLNRKHLTVEETESAAKAKFGDDAGVVRDIRTLAMATAKLQDAIAGRVLVNKIKTIGRETGAATVADSIPEGTTHKWFTIDTPALKTWRPRMQTGKEFQYAVEKQTRDGDTRVLKWHPTQEAAEADMAARPDKHLLSVREGRRDTPMTDAQGNLIFDKVPVYVRGDFEGPLRAVLNGKDGMVYRTLMNLKAKTMSVIMYSPLIHNGVEWGRALAAMPGKVATFKVYFEGNAAKNDPVQMRQAIEAGLVPIGARYGFQDISSILEEPNLTPGRSWTAKLLAAVPGLFNENAGLAVKRAVDKAGDVWHNTLLWDRVADLQMGLYTNFRDNLIKKGADEATAQRLAAHLANRYAGAVPIESMSHGARKFANLALFSRSFTLGNLGAMKDALVGVPSDVKSQILRDAGKLAGTQAEKYVRRKSQAVVALDIALNYIMNSAFSSAIAVMFLNTSAKDEAFGYLKRLQGLLQRGKENALELLNPMEDMALLTPGSENEPGKEGRIYIGRADDGSAVYMRLPMGKIGEEFEGWLTRPLEMLKAKGSTIARPIYETLANDKGFGRKVYDPYDNTPGASLRRIGDIVTNFLGEQIPLSAIDGAKKLATGEGDSRVNAMQSLAPLGGITVSRGAKGGPEMGEYYASKTEHDLKVQRAMPDIRDMIRNGKRDEAIQQMTELGIPPATQASYMRSTLNPRRAPSPSQLAGFRRYATKEQRERLNAAAEKSTNR